MSKHRKQQKDVAPAQTDAHEALRARAEAVNIKIDALLAAGMVDDATTLVDAVEAKIEAEKIAAQAGRTNNRFDLFRRRIQGQILKHGKPTLVEDREYFAGLTELYPREGRGGGSSDWSNKGVAKALAVLDSLHAKGQDWDLYFQAYRKVCEGAKDGKATGIVYLS